MINNKWFNNKSVRYRWILSYLILICFFTCSMCISISCFFNTHKNEMVRTNVYVMDIVEEEYNYIFSDIKNVLYGSITGEMRKLIKDSFKITENHAHLFTDIQLELKRLVGNRNNFEQCFLYFDKYDVIINTTSVMSSRLYYSAYFENSGYSYEDWLSMIKKDTKSHFITIKNGSSNKFMCVNTKTITSLFYEDGISLVFILNDRKVDGINERIYNTSGAYILMASEGDTVCNISRNPELDGFVYEDVYKKGNESYIKLNGKTYLFLNSDKTARSNFVLLIPRSNFYKELISIVLIHVIMLLAVVALGIVMSFKFSSFHFMPVETIMKALDKDKSTKGKNEYTLIIDAIKSARQEKNSLDIKYKKQSIRMRKNFLRRILKGETELAYKIDDGLKLYDIQFEHPNYMVLAFEITEFKDLWMTASDDVDFDTAIMALDNIIEEKFSQKYICYTTDIGEQLVCVLNFDSDEDDNVENDLMEIYEFIKDFTHNNLGFDFSMTTSLIKNNRDELYEAYNEAISCSEYNLIYEKNVVFTKDVELYESHNLNDFYLQTSHLINEIVYNKDKDIEDEIDDWCREYSSKMIMFPTVLQYKFHSFVDALIKELLTANLSEEEITSFVKEISKELRAEDGTLELNEKLVKITDKFRHILNSDKKDVSVVERIIEYIEKNYMDLDLNVTKIANHFDFNVTYLSNLFKKRTHIGILDLINKTRCEKSVTLLKETKLSINEIAQKVGYQRVHTYLRVFKKYYFCTPTDYRRKLCGNDNEE